MKELSLLPLDWDQFGQNCLTVTMKPILYAEDDESDAALMQQIFEDVGIQHPLRIVPDGTRAMAYLSQTGEFADASRNPRPALVILDLRLPDKRGVEVIQWMRSHPLLVDIPIIVLTASNHKTDIHRAYLLGANAFFVKPSDPEELAGVIRTLKEQWLDDLSVRSAFRQIAAFRRPEDGMNSAPGKAEASSESTSGRPEAIRNGDDMWSASDLAFAKRELRQEFPFKADDVLAHAIERAARRTSVGDGRVRLVQSARDAVRRPEQ